MPTINKYIANIDSINKQFIGTIAFKSEEITLPDGSKMALGLDDGHWVLIYQTGPNQKMEVFNIIVMKTKY